jgi:5-hydroxyisourate hydrolase-like protein (transthyretin family)
VNGAAAATLRYRADAATRVRVTLLDANGRLLSLLREEDVMPGEYRMQVFLGDRPAGLYFVEFQSGRDHRLAKLLKQ